MGSPLRAWDQRTVKAVEACHFTHPNEGQVSAICWQSDGINLLGFGGCAVGGLLGKRKNYKWKILRKPSVTTFGHSCRCDQVLLDWRLLTLKRCSTSLEKYSFISVCWLQFNYTMLCKILLWHLRYLLIYPCIVYFQKILVSDVSISFQIILYACSYLNTVVYH